MGLQDIVLNKLFETILEHGRTYLIKFLEQNEPKFREKLIEFLCDSNWDFLPDYVESITDNALRDAITLASPKLTQLIIDGLKLHTAMDVQLSKQ